MRYCLRSIVFNLLMLGGFMASYGQGKSFQLDLLALDSAVMQITGPGLNQTGSSKSVMTCATSGAGSCVLSIKVRDRETALVRFSVNGQAAISNVEVRRPGPGATEYAAMPSTRFVLSSGNKKLRLIGSTIQVGWNGTDIGGVKFGHPVSNNGSFNLFPGFQQVISANGNSLIGLYLNLDGSLASTTYWKAGLADGLPWEKLHADFYTVSGATLNLLGKAVVFDAGLETTLSYSLPGMIAGKTNLGNTAPESRKLLPGEYVLRAKEGDLAVSELKFSLENGSGQLSRLTSWKDLGGNLTGGAFVALEAGHVYLEPLKLAPVTALPSGFVFGGALLPHAILQDQLDGSCYLATDETFRFRYDERYNESSNLKLRLLDESNAEVVLANPVQRHYGTNWVSLSLPAADFPAGSTYVLEVLSEKGDLGVLRFRVGN